MLQIKVNGDKIIEIRKEGNTFFVGNKPMEWDIQAIGSRSFHIIYNNISYNATLLEFDAQNKIFKIKMNQRIYDLEVKDLGDLLLEKTGINPSSISKQASIKAPMPGLIVNMNVVAGQMVNEGDPLLVLEAMKMENIIKSPGNRIIKSIHVTTGQNVEKNQLLIDFEI